MLLMTKICNLCCTLELLEALLPWPDTITKDKSEIFCFNTLTMELVLLLTLLFNPQHVDEINRCLAINQTNSNPPPLPTKHYININVPQQLKYILLQWDVPGNKYFTRNTNSLSLLSFGHHKALNDCQPLWTTLIFCNSTYKQFAVQFQKIPICMGYTMHLHIPKVVSNFTKTLHCCISPLCLHQVMIVFKAFGTELSRA